MTETRVRELRAPSEVASQVATTPASIRRWRDNETVNEAVRLFDGQCRMQRTLARGHHDYVLCGRLMLEAFNAALALVDEAGLSGLPRGDVGSAS